MPWQLQKHGKLSHLARVNTMADLWFIDAWVPILFERGSHHSAGASRRKVLCIRHIRVYSCIRMHYHVCSAHQTVCQSTTLFSQGRKRAQSRDPRSTALAVGGRHHENPKFFDRTHINELVSLTQKITKNPSVWTWFTCVHVICVDVYDKHGYFFPTTCGHVLRTSRTTHASVRWQKVHGTSHLNDSQHLKSLKPELLGGTNHGPLVDWLFVLGTWLKPFIESNCYPIVIGIFGFIRASSARFLNIRPL